MNRHASANIKVNGENFRVGEWGNEEKGVKKLIQEEIDNARKKVKKSEYIAEFVLGSLGRGIVGSGEIGPGKYEYPACTYEATIDEKGKLHFRKTSDYTAFEEHMKLKAKDYKMGETIETLQQIVKDDYWRIELKSLLKKLKEE